MVKLFLFGVLFAGCAAAQPASIVFRPFDPSGSCGGNSAWMNSTNANLWGCASNVWTLTNSGGTGLVASVTGTNGITASPTTGAVGVGLANPTVDPFPFAAPSLAATGSYPSCLLFGDSTNPTLPGNCTPGSHYTVVGIPSTANSTIQVDGTALATLPTCTDAQIITYAGTTPTCVDVSGDATMDNTGDFSITNVQLPIFGTITKVAGFTSGGAFVYTNPTGSGSPVLATSPTLTNPTVGTQTAGDASGLAASTQFVTTAVANALAGVNPAVAVLAASTANVTGTYSNGASGIGATFTVTATGAFSLDGVSIGTIGQRVLLKNQSSAFQNGMYTATVVGVSLVSPVFTRALDYDQPSDINNTGAIPVQQGTANGLTSWLLTSTVNTVGTDALTYSRFTQPTGGTFSGNGYGMWVLNVPAGLTTWANQGSAASGSGTNFVSIAAPPATSPNLRVLNEPCPAPFTAGTVDLYALVLFSSGVSSTSAGGIEFDDGTKYFVIMQVMNTTSSEIITAEYNNTSTFNTSVNTDGSIGPITTPIWYHVHDAAGSLTLDYSFDGVGTPGTNGGWRRLTSSSSGGLSAVTNCGFFATPGSTSFGGSTTLLSYAFVTSLTAQ